MTYLIFIVVFFMRFVLWGRGGGISACLSPAAVRVGASAALIWPRFAGKQACVNETRRKVGKKCRISTKICPKIPKSNVVVR